MSDKTKWMKWKRRLKNAGRLYPLAFFALAATYSYLADCFIAHPSHPELPWIESGVHCGGPLGFVTTVAIIVAGILYCFKKGL